MKTCQNNFLLIVTYIVAGVAVDIHLAGLVLCGRLALAHVCVICVVCMVEFLVC